ncbi:MAG: NUDIX domain-containing protein [Pseudomonadota bacterium]
MSTLVEAQGLVLLAKRGKSPARGLWSLPGGSVEFGERLADAAVREVREETAIKIPEPRFCETVEVIADTYHFVIAVFHARLETKAKVRAGDDADEAGWFSLSEIEALDHKSEITPGTAQRIARLIKQP